MQKGMCVCCKSVERVGARACEWLMRSSNRCQGVQEERIYDGDYHIADPWFVYFVQEGFCSRSERFSMNMAFYS